MIFAVLVLVFAVACSGCRGSERTGVSGSAGAPTAASAGGYTSPVLPVLLIETGGKEVPESDKIRGTIKVIEEHDGSLTDLARRPAALESVIGIEVHGETTATLPKRSYDFEVVNRNGRDRAVPLLGLPKGSDWTLNGCGRDETCLRDTLVFAVTRDVGRYAPRTRFVELFLNGSYQGLYVLEEKVRRDNDRVDLPKPAPDETAGDISGGYIFRLDLGEGRPGDAIARDWISPESQLVYSYYYPRYDDITPAQKAYLEKHVARFEALMRSSQWNDPRRGYRAWIDVPSWVDFALTQELSNNVDAYFKSVYLQKWPESAGNKLAVGPVWDFDTAFGVGDFRGGREIDSWAHTMNRFGMQAVPYDPPGEVPPVPEYWERLWTDPAFTSDLQCRWRELRRGPLDLSSLDARIDAWVTQLRPAQRRDGEVWNNPTADGYPGEVEYLKSWLDERLAWMDANLPGVCQS